MHFLTLAAVEIPPQEENLVENKWVEEQKKELLEKLEKNEKKDVFLQTVPLGTFWAFLNQEGKLCLRNTKPDQTTRNVIQIRISQG